MKSIGPKVKRDWRALSVVGVLLVVAFLFSVTRSNEPSYQGKKLTQWLEELGDPEPELQGDAELRRWHDVFHHMGTNAIPFLLKRIQAEDSALKAKVIGWAERHDVSVLGAFG